MRGTEVLRLVWLNIIQNKFKSIMTSIGIVVGAATIVMVIAIGRGGQMDVAEQFSSLNAGAIDVSYEMEGETTGGGGFSFGNIGNFMMGGLQNMFGGRGSGSRDSSSGGNAVGGMDFGGASEGFGGMQMPGGSSDASGGGMPDMSQMGGGNMPDMSQMGGGEMSDRNQMGGGEMSDRNQMGDGEMPDRNQMGDGEMPDMSQMGSGEMPDRNQMGDDEMSSMPDGGDSGEGDSSQRGNRENRAENQEEDSGENPEAVSEGAFPEEESESEQAADAEDETEEETSITDDRMNLENIILSVDDVEDIETFVPGVSEATISYTTRGSIEGGNLTEAQTYTVAGVKESYGTVSNLTMAAGGFITEADDNAKSRVCVLGSSVAKELFGSAIEAYNSTIYIDDRAYTINGVLASTGMVSAGITPDEAIFIPYETGIKYVTGENISPTITVISADVNAVDQVIESVEYVLSQNYSNAKFTFEDAGSKMEAAESSNEILTMLLTAMAVIVFIIGGIGIMNVLFVSVKERTNEIGILKALGASGSAILIEFLLESAAISFMGGVLGVGLSFAITPVVEHYGVRVEPNAFAWAAALGFAVLTGTLFGVYPAWKASKLVPVEALNAE